MTGRPSAGVPAAPGERGAEDESEGVMGIEPMFDLSKFVVGLLSLGAMLLVMVVMASRVAYWERRFWQSLVAGSNRQWRDHCRSARGQFLRSLSLRDQAFFELNGARLDLADELLREDLHTLGGLAGVW